MQPENPSTTWMNSKMVSLCVVHVLSLFLFERLLLAFPQTKDWALRALPSHFVSFRAAIIETDL